MLSFTSIVTDLRFNEVPAAGTPVYPGILLRNITLDPIEESAYQSLKTEFKDNGIAVRRAWFFGAEIGAQSVLTFRRGDKAVHANALLGLDPDEAAVTKPQNSLFAGRWFSKGALNEAILPLSVADQFHCSHK